MSKKKSKRYNDANNDLDAILSVYPTLSILDIEKFTPVYFPIAIVEMDTLERSFEDFDTIELFVLQLVETGVTTSKAISNLLGLDERYVSRIMALLNGYGHIENGRITELGIESLQKERKIELKAGTQQFQLNALNGNVIRLEELISTKQIDEKKTTRASVAHLMSIDGIEIQELKGQFENEDYANFVKTAQSQTVNLEKITDVRFLEMKYAYCYLLKLKNMDPMIFCRRFNYSESDIKERFKWIPMSVPNHNFYKKLNLPETLSITTDLEREKMASAIQMLDDQRKRVDLEKMEENYMLAIDQTYPFDFSNCKLHDFSNGLILDVNENAFKEYTKKLYYILKYIGKTGMYIIVRDNLYGDVIHVESTSDYLTRVSEKLANKIDEFGEKRVRSKIDEYFESNDKRGEVIEIINDVLDKIR